jgi:hypothetical protein
MNINDFKDGLFEILNETNELPIADIDTDDRNNQFKVVLQDGTQFLITVEPHGRLFILR